MPPGPNQTVQAGSGVDFTVLSATLVRINALVNGMVSLAIPAAAVAAQSHVRPKEKKTVDMTRVPARYQNLVGKLIAQYA